MVSPSAMVPRGVTGEGEAGGIAVGQRLLLDEMVAVFVLVYVQVTASPGSMSTLTVAPLPVFGAGRCRRHR